MGAEDWVPVNTPTGQALAKAVRSPNRRFLLAFYSGVGGGEGGVALVEGEQARWRVRAVPPEDGHVTNDGTVIFADWLNTAALAGEFLVVSVQGTTLLRRQFKANVYRTGVTTDSGFGWVTTANSDDEEDSGVLEVFDLGTGRSVLRLHPYCQGDVRTVEREGADWVVVSGRGMRAVVRDDGSVANQDEVFMQEWDQLVREGRWAALVYQVRDAWSGTPAESLVAAIRSRFASWSTGLDASEESHGVKATGHRVIGEILQSYGDKGGALAEFEAAVRFNPKIGLKRRILELRGGSAGTQ